MAEDELKALKRTLRDAVVQGRFDDARRIFEEQVAPSGAPQHAKAALLAKLSQAGVKGLDKQLETFKQEGGRKSEVRLASLEAQGGRTDEALARLDAVAEAKRLSKQERALRAELLTRSQRPAEAFEEAVRLFREHPERADFALLVIRATFVCGQFRAGVQQLAKAMARWPNDGQFLKLVHRLPLPPHVFQQLYAMAQSNRGQGQMPPFAQYMFALLALRAWQVDEALDALSEAENIPHAALLRRALLTMAPDQWRARSRLQEDDTRPYEEVRHAQAQATLLYFPGAFNKFAQMPVAFLDALLSDLPLNVLYLRDRRSRAFLEGAPGLGASQQEAASAIAELVARLEAPRTCVMGLSIGGFSALRYGAILGADAAITFGGATVLHGAGGPEEEEGGGLFSSWRFDAYSERDRDVLPDVEEHPQMKVVQAVGGDNFEDTRQAARIAGLPQVETVTIPGVADHVGLVHRLIVSDEFEPLMRRSLGLA